MSGNLLCHRAQMSAKAWGSALVFALGLTVTGCSPAVQLESKPAGAALVATASASPSVMPSECDVEGSRQTFNEETYYCTRDEAKALLWMSLDGHDKAVAAKAVKTAKEEAQAVKAAEERKAKEAEAARVAEAEEAEAEKKAALDKAAEASAFPNCSSAAAVGAFNIPAGAPGYGPHLDSDRDGIACENAAVQGPIEQPAQPVQQVQVAPYANCSAARAAGAAPVYRGQPGYGAHLDRDSDGVGCE